MLDWGQCRRRLLGRRTAGTRYLYVISMLGVSTVYDGFSPIPVAVRGGAAVLLAAEIAIRGPAICGYLDVGPVYPLSGTVFVVFAVVVSESISLPLSELPDALGFRCRKTLYPCLRLPRL